MFLKGSWTGSNKLKGRQVNTMYKPEDAENITRIYGPCRKVSSKIMSMYGEESLYPITTRLVDLTAGVIPGPTDGGIPGFGKDGQLLALQAIRAQEDSPNLLQMLKDFYLRLPRDVDYIGDKDNPLAWYMTHCNNNNEPFLLGEEHFLLTSEETKSNNFSLEELDDLFR